MVAASGFICVLIVLLSTSRRRCFAVDDGSVSGDGHRFRCCTVGELWRDSDWVSVIAVRRKCDEKGLRADWGHRSVRCRKFGRAPFGYPARLRSGLRQNRAGFLEKREKGRTPGTPLISVNVQRQNRDILSTLMWPTLYNRVGVVKGHVEHSRSAMLSSWR